MNKVLLLGASMLGLFEGLFANRQQIPQRETPRKPKTHHKPPAYQAVVHYTNPDPRQATLNKMTNWQRNQYGRARAKNGNRDLSIDEMQKFTTLTKEQHHG